MSLLTFPNTLYATVTQVRTMRKRVLPAHAILYKAPPPFVYRKNPHDTYRIPVAKEAVTTDFLAVGEHRLIERALLDRDASLTPETNIMVSAEKLIKEYQETYARVKQVLKNSKNDNLAYDNFNPLQNLKFTGLVKAFDKSKRNEITKLFDLRAQITSLTNIRDFAKLTRGDNNNSKGAECLEIKSRERLIEKFSVGDHIKVYSTEVATGKSYEFSGIVLVLRENGYSTTFSVRNIIEGVAIEKTMFLYNPAITRIETLSRRQYKTKDITYLRKANPIFTTV